jgi:hypothetical protein
VRVLAVHLVFALHPALLVVDLGTPLGRVVEVLRGPPEVLHAVRVVTVRPIMLLVENRAERGLITVQQKVLKTQVALKLIQVLGKALLGHDLL